MCYFVLLLVVIFVVLGAAAREVLEAVAARAPFFARTELFWLVGAGFLVEEVVRVEEVALGADSFSGSAVTAGLQSPAMGTAGRRGRSVRTGCVSILAKCSARTTCCLRSWCCCSSCSRSLKNPGGRKVEPWAQQEGLGLRDGSDKPTGIPRRLCIGLGLGRDAFPQPLIRSC